MHGRSESGLGDRCFFRIGRAVAQLPTECFEGVIDEFGDWKLTMRIQVIGFRLDRREDAVQGNRAELGIQSPPEPA
jgi:hypothetical protein